MVGPRMTTWSEVSLRKERKKRGQLDVGRDAKTRKEDKLDARKLNNASGGGEDLVGVGPNEESVLPLGDGDGESGSRRFLRGT